MIIWMRHKDHGQMPLYDQGDVEKHKKLGWEVFDKPAEKAKRKAAEAKAAEEAEAAAATEAEEAAKASKKTKKAE